MEQASAARRVIAIDDAGTEVGAALAIALATRGFHLLLCGRHTTALDRVSEIVRGQGGTGCETVTGAPASFAEACRGKGLAAIVVTDGAALATDSGQIEGAQDAPSPIVVELDADSSLPGKTDPEELAASIADLMKPRSFAVRATVRTIPAAVRRAERVVFANGVFDLLHPGHIAVLRFAKSFGDKLIVGINSDRSVRLLKGPTRPVRSEAERKAVLESIRYVDQVVIFDEMRTTQIVRKLMPDIIVKGDEYTPEAIRAADNVPDGIEIVTYPMLFQDSGEKFSTTATVDKLQRSV